MLQNNSLVLLGNILHALQKQEGGQKLANFTNLIGVHRANFADGAGDAFGLESSKTGSGRATKKTNEVRSKRVRVKTG